MHEPQSLLKVAVGVRQVGVAHGGVHMSEHRGRTGRSPFRVVRIDDEQVDYLAIVGRARLTLQTLWLCTRRPGLEFPRVAAEVHSLDQVQIVLPVAQAVDATRCRERSYDNVLDHGKRDVRTRLSLDPPPPYESAIGHTLLAGLDDHEPRTVRH